MLQSVAGFPWTCPNFLAIHQIYKDCKFCWVQPGFHQIHPNVVGLCTRSLRPWHVLRLHRAPPNVSGPCEFAQNYRKTTETSQSHTNFCKTWKIIESLWTNPNFMSFHRPYLGLAKIYGTFRFWPPNLPKSHKLLQRSKKRIEFHTNAQYFTDFRLLQRLCRHRIPRDFTETNQLQFRFSGLCKRLRNVLEKQKFTEFHRIYPDITNHQRTSQALPLNITDSTQTSPDFAKLHGSAWTVSEFHQVQPKLSGPCKQSRKVYEKQKFAELNRIYPDITTH